MSYYFLNYTKNVSQKWYVKDLFTPHFEKKLKGTYAPLTRLVISRVWVMQFLPPQSQTYITMN